MAAHFSVTRTPNETSVVCEAGREPEGSRVEPGWRLLEFAGPFAFDECGILSAVLVPLAEAHIGIFALSTFDTDWLLIKEGNLPRAVGALTAAGHDVEDAGAAVTE
jgi:hypothetical protein